MNVQPLFQTILWFIFLIMIAAGCSTFRDLNLGEESFYQGDFASAEMYFTRVIEAKEANS